MNSPSGASNALRLFALDMGALALARLSQATEAAGA